VEDADGGSTAGEDAAAVDGVHVDAFARGGWVSAVGPAGGSGELEGEWVLVRGGPFGDDVGDDASVVGGGCVEGAAYGAAEVDSMHPHVTGEADVVEVAERLPVLRSQPEERQRPDRSGHSTPGTKRLRRD
jgi:hypothetical protein